MYEIVKYTLFIVNLWIAENKVLTYKYFIHENR